jgi:hypothetical protein
MTTIQKATCLGFVTEVIVGSPMFILLVDPWGPAQSIGQLSLYIHLFPGFLFTWLVIPSKYQSDAYLWPWFFSCFAQFIAWSIIWYIVSWKRNKRALNKRVEASVNSSA